MDGVSFASPALSTPMVWVLLAAVWAAFAVSAVLSRVLARTSILPDTPNERSSHARVTPQSGGVAVFAGWAVGVVVLAFFLSLMGEPTDCLGLLLLAGAAFLLGAADDAFTLSAGLKFLGQTAIAATFALTFGVIEALPLPGLGVTVLGVFALPVTVLWIVSVMNVYNFMDGANGMASGAAVTALSALAVAGAVADAGAWPAVAMLAAAAVFGFAPVNLAGGRLFLGDNGSQMLGFLLAALGVAVGRESGGAVDAVFMGVVLLPFVFDVAFTLVHRGMRGANLAEAHREHLYQLRIRLGRSHASTAAVYFAATAVSAAAAMAMLALPAGWRWAAPAALVLAALPAATRLYRRGAAAGLLPSARAARRRNGARPAEPSTITASTLANPAE